MWKQQKLKKNSSIVYIDLEEWSQVRGFCLEIVNPKLKFCVHYFFFFFFFFFFFLVHYIFGEVALLGATLSVTSSVFHSFL